MNCDKIGNCDQCPRWFDEGKDFCKSCGFDLNSYNQPEEEEEERCYTCEKLQSELGEPLIYYENPRQGFLYCEDCYAKLEDSTKDEEEECVLCGGFCSDDYQADVEGNEETVCEDCFERLEKCEMCGDATDEEEWCDIQADVLYCSHCKAKHQATIAKCEAIVKSSESQEETLAKYLESKAKAVAYNPLEGLNAKQIARIERIRAEWEIARIERLLIVVKKERETILKELSRGREEEEECICESDKKPNPLCPDHQCCWACSTQSVPITLNEHDRLWLCGGCNDKGDWCRGCHKLIDEDGMCSPGCDYYQWEGVWTCHRCDTERCDEPYCKKCCHPDDIAVYASEYAERSAVEKERETILKELSQVIKEEDETEVYGICYECGVEGKFIGKDGDDWCCVDCSSIS